MCGFNVLLSNNQKFNGIDIQRMNDAIKHRGPDDEGYVGLDNKLVPKNYSGKDSKNQNHEKIEQAISSHFFLAHRRLSIMDVEDTGYQPMLKDNRFLLVFNGEIYNYLEIAQNLNFQANNDSEVIVEAYKKWGEKCVEHFNGMWAFCLIDLEKQNVFLSRDRFGIKPLYYCFQNGKLAIASEIKSILKSKLFDIGIDNKECIAYLKYGSSEYKKETLFTDIYRFPKASIQTFSLSDLSLFHPKTAQVFWDINKLPKIKSDHATKDYLNLFKRSVSLRLRSKVKVGSALSGGLDSSAIVAMVRELRKNTQLEQHTFSTVYNKEESKFADESEFIDQLVNLLGLTSHKIEPKLDELIKDHQNLIYIHDTPPNGIMIAAYNTFKLVGKSDVKVTLDGQGADEILAGYLKYLPNYFIHAKKIDSAEIEQLLTIPRAKPLIKKGLRLKPFRAFFSNPIFKTIYLLVAKKPFLTGLNLQERLIYDINHNLSNLIHYLDRNSMAYSVESRTPYLDYKLVEFLLGIEKNVLIADGWTKAISRKAMIEKLPQEIVWRKDKMGWENPTEFYFKGPLKTYVLKTIRDSTILPKLGKKYSITESNLNNFKNEEIAKMLNLSIWFDTFQPFLRDE